MNKGLNIKVKSPAPDGQRLNNSGDKGSHFRTQYQITYQFFKERPKTMLEVSDETGIRRANICRYIDKMRKKGQLELIHRGLCPVTHCRSGFYSTDESLFNKSDVQQLNLFDNGI
jgi:predicted transcriptional regulator of viral defense system